MLLKELQKGQRFMFSDRKTPLALTTARGQYGAGGVFVYQDVYENVCPKLLHEETGKVVIPVSATYYRDVLVLF